MHLKTGACMCVCVYVTMYVTIFACMYEYVFACMYVCERGPFSVACFVRRGRIHVCVHVHVYMDMCMYSIIQEEAHEIQPK